jgi:hypothetical protein
MKNLAIFILALFFGVGILPKEDSAAFSDSEELEFSLIIPSYHQKTKSCYEICGCCFAIRCDYGGEGCTPEMQWFCDEVCYAYE